MAKTPLLRVESLYANVEDKRILKGLCLSVGSGEVHLIMGPNGGGKSTLASVLMGHPKYSVSSGKIMFKGKDITDAEPDERSKAGIFLALQYPTEIAGISFFNFLRSAMNTRRKEPISLADFREKAEKALGVLKMDPQFLERSVNEGFSGGEKKRAEVLQMLLLSPDLAILDETDSGLDVDSLKVVASAINRMRGKTFSAIVITHNPRILKYLKPDRIHVLSSGKIAKSGGAELAKEIEKSGYAGMKEETP
jgi:Fe-S cluster assembly ATP-binding protein